VKLASKVSTVTRHCRSAKLRRSAKVGEVIVRETTPPATTRVTARGADESPEFDYSVLPPSVARFLRGQAARIHQYSSKAIIQIGKDLAGAKHYLSHGQFLRWVEDEVGIPARSAQKYMRVASWASSKSATVTLLPPTALYALSAPSLPAEFVDGVLKRVEAGDPLRVVSLRAEIKALRETSQENKSSSRGGSNEQPDDGQGGPYATATMISDAVRILARALSDSDFAKVRDIITSAPVLNDPNLPRILARAFIAAM
jgi:hypothetical protein